MYETIEDLNKMSKECKLCSLAKLRKNVVLGQGKIDSDIMIIGNVPSAEDEVRDSQLNGKAGNLMQFALQTVGINMQDVYITNILKCRPINTKNLEAEYRTCINYLRNEVILISPKIIILLGKNVTDVILGKDIILENIKGEFIEKKGIKYLVLNDLKELLSEEDKKIEFLKGLEKIGGELKNEN